jgi:hypothetical protein
MNFESYYPAMFWADFITPLVAIGLYVASRRTAVVRTRPSA